MGMLDKLRNALDPSNHIPLWRGPPAPGRFGRFVLPDRLIELVEKANLQDLGHGVDAFGMSRDGVVGGLLTTWLFYDHWFRVTSHNAHHVPDQGGAVLACNHSGTLPLDAMMVWADVVRHSPTHRVPRVIMDHFVPELPGVSTLFIRAGGIGGSRGNFHAVLDSGQLLLVFPEGVPGIGKPFSERYKLQRWREGHAELAIRHGVPVVPIAVIGAEEQMPQIARIQGVNVFGIPYLPIPATLFPLPVHYHVWYGEPIPLHERYTPDQAKDPAAVAAAALEVQAAVQALIDHGLTQREGIFR